MRPITSSTIRNALHLWAFIFVSLLFIAQIGCAQSPVAPTQEGTPGPDNVAARIQRNSQRIEAIKQSDNRLNQMLASLPTPSQDDMTGARRKSEQLALALAAAQNSLQEIQRANPAFTNSAAELEKQLADIQQTRDELVKKQTEALSVTNTSTATNGLDREVTLKDMKAIPIMLVKNRVVPIMDPFYSIQRADLKMALTGETVPGIVATRVHDGESIGNAVRPGGLLDAFIRKSDPSSTYFKFNVCDDSIAAFHKAVEAVSAHGFAYAWDTGKDKDFMQPINQTQINQFDRGYRAPSK